MINLLCGIQITLGTCGKCRMVCGTTLSRFRPDARQAGRGYIDQQKVVAAKESTPPLNTCTCVCIHLKIYSIYLLLLQLVGNKQPAFLEQRREQLETYLQGLLTSFRNELPRLLAEFLNFNKYDITYLLQDLAKLFNESGDALLSSKKEYNLSALEVSPSR